MTEEASGLDLDVLLREGARVLYLDEPYRISRQEAGTLVLPSGKLVACDPLTIQADVIPLSVSIAPGRYRVVGIVLQEFDEPHSDRVAYCAGLQLVIRDEPVARWEPARWEGSTETGAAYAVDRGVAAFMDLEAARALVGWTSEQQDSIVDALETNYLTIEVDHATGANAVISDSGGDGLYGVWIGYTASRQVATFITEFQILDD